ncbi:MAG: DUF5132 domain-containing protein [Zoogloea sp.]|nr:DUF5132 domain-containing protein [Zoogloea sp.]
MVVIDDLLESKLLAGVAILAGTVILAPVVAPVLVGVARPLVKSVIKAGYMFYERGAEMFAEVGEVMEDLVAEVKSEIKAGRPEMAEAVPETSEIPPEAAAPEAAS